MIGAGMRRALAALVLLGAPAGAGLTHDAAAQEAPAARETFLGVLKAGGADLHVAVHVDGAAHGGAFDSLDQGQLGIPLADVKRDAALLSFSVPSIGARYEGAWSAAGARFEGIWRQGAAALPLSLAKGEVAKRPTVAGLDGAWDGVLDVGAMGRLRMVFTVTTTKDGTTATFSSPDQGPAAAPVLSLSRQGDAVLADIPLLKAKFEATLSPDGRVLAGRWTQNGASMPLALARRASNAAPPPERPRPQTPQPPFPYASLEVGYDNPKGRNHLAGTLTVPEGRGPFPAALLITGSGLQDRDETILGHKPFLVLADALSRRGIAVLRVDDRTMGGSTGDVVHATSADFATDVEAGIGFLLARPEIDHKKIGLIGHSEGGMIAPMVAARNPSVAFIVMMAGPGETGEAVILEQQRLISRAMGLPEEQVAKSNASQAKILKAVMAAPDAASARAAAVAVLTGDGLPAPQAEAAASQVASDWFRYFLAYDPVPALKAVRVPVLALNGGLDLQVPAAANLAAVRKALVANPDATAIELPGLNHLFQTAKTGAPSEYREIEETIAPVALSTICDWVAARTGVSGPGTLQTSGRPPR